MTGDKTAYTYRENDAPSRKINYSYSAYGGEAFLENYLIYRREFLIDHETEPDLNLARYLDTATGRLFAGWINDSARIDEPAVELLVKRFEVLKKIYTAYNELMRPLDKQSYTDLRLYVLFSYLMLERYQATNHLYYLNALLKSNDICCSAYDLLAVEDRRLLSLCITGELTAIRRLRSTLL